MLVKKDSIYQKMVIIVQQETVMLAHLAIQIVRHVQIVLLRVTTKIINNYILNIYLLLKLVLNVIIMPQNKMMEVAVVILVTMKF